MIDNELLRRALANFDLGEFRKVNAILEAEAIQQDVKRLKFDEKAATDRLAALRDELEKRLSKLYL